MSSGSLENTTSSKKAYEALRVFSTIMAGDKLIFHKTRDIFEIAKDRFGKGFVRSFKNSFRKNGTENSVTNDEMFHRPIIMVFKIAKFTATDNTELNKAYLGLCKLKETYNNDNQKMESLNKTLTEVQNIINDQAFNFSATSLEKLTTALSKQAKLIFSQYARAADELVENAISQQLTQPVERALKHIFGSVRNDRTNVGAELKIIGENLDYFSQKKYNKTMEIGSLSNKIYNILQRADEFQNHIVSGYPEWIRKLKDAVQAKNFSTCFQSDRKINLGSDVNDHPSNDFLWFKFDQVKVNTDNCSRLYFCPLNMHSIDRFIRVAGDILYAAQFKFTFKIDYRKNLIFKRRDLVVLYYEGDSRVGERLSTDFKNRLGAGYLNSNQGPFNSKSVSPDNDVFFQKEPEMFDTGLSVKEEKYKEINQVQTRTERRQYSATSIRAELITMALLKWKIEFDYQVVKCRESGLDVPNLDNPPTFEYEYEMFRSFVARALQGHEHLI